MYGITQMTTVLFLGSSSLYLADNQYLWEDMGLVFFFIWLIPLLYPAKKITKGKPENNLLSHGNLISVFGNSIIMVLFQALANYVALQQDFSSLDAKIRSKEPESYSNGTWTSVGSSLFVFSNFCYVFVGLSFSLNLDRSRQGVLTNRYYMVFLAGIIGVNLLYVLYRDTTLYKVFNLVDFPWSYRVILLVLIVSMGTVFILFEAICVKHTSDDEDPLRQQGKRKLFRHPFRTSHPLYVVLKDSADMILSRK